jgi:hypothetical protein
MEKKIIFYSKKSFLPNTSLQKIGEEIYNLKDRSISNIYDTVAKNEKSELHKHLTWDNKIAGKNWRKYEIKKIVSTIVYKIIEIDKDKKEDILIEDQRAFDTIGKDDKKKEVIFVVEDIKKKDKRTILFEKLQEEFESIQNRIKEYNRIVDFILDLNNKWNDLNNKLNK